MKLVSLIFACVLVIANNQTAWAQSASSSPATSCSIYLTAACKTLPVGQWFVDSADTANRDAVRCDKRSLEYSEFCGFVDAQYAYAVFQSSGVNSSFAVTYPPSSSGSGTSLPTYNTYFIDVVNGSLLGQLK